MSKKTVNTSAAPAAIGPYSQAVIADGFLFVSGQIPLDPETGQIVSGSIEDEAVRVMSNLSAILEEAGVGMADIVKTTIYLTDLADFAKVNEVYGRYFSSDPPARVTVQVAGLPKGARMEIDAIAKIR